MLRKTILLSFLFLAAVLLCCGTAAADTVTVTTIGDLQANVSGATGDRTIILGDGFPSELPNAVALTVNNNANIIIEGKTGTKLSVAGNFKHFILSDSSSTAGNIEFRNIEFIGRIPDSELEPNGSFKSIDHNNLPAGGGFLGSVKGDLIFENCTFKQIRGTVLSGSASIILKNTTALSNSGGARIILETGQALYVENCTFAYNYASGAYGYAGGLFYLTGNTKSEIINSVFCENNFLGGGPVQGGGGVIAYVYGSETSSLRIEDCIFEKNFLNSSGTGAKTADGGVFYMFHSKGAITISGSSFLNNTACDEGGAMAYVNSANSSNRIESCTFIGNKALGKQESIDGPDAGGAIELDTGSSVTFEGNTFIKNTAEIGNGFLGANYGGAISLNDSSTAVLINNIISGNSAEAAAKYNNIYCPSKSTVTYVGNSNVIQDDIAGIFGTSSPELIALGTKKIGDPKTTQFYTTIKTLPIIPEGDAWGIGETGTSKTDQNGNKRSLVLPNSGSVEMRYVKYDVNDGIWHDDENLTADVNNGTVFFETLNSEIIYKLYPVDEEIPSMKDPTHATLFFGGWEEELEKDNDENESGNLKRTAIWKSDYLVIFQDCDGTELKRENVLPGADATAPADPSRSGYTFTGWDKDFTNVQSDLTVTAQYKKEEVKPTKPADKSSSGRNTPGSGMSGEKEGYEIQEMIPKIIKPVLVILFFVIAIACYFYVRNSRED